MSESTNMIDGEVAVYLIERRWRDPRTGKLYEGWQTLEPSPRDLGEKPFSESGTGWEESAPMAYQFSSCGACWQRTGLHGVFDEAMAMRAFVALTQHNTDRHLYRVTKREIRVHNTVLASTPEPVITTTAA